MTSTWEEVCNTAQRSETAFDNFPHCCGHPQRNTCCWQTKALQESLTSRSWFKRMTKLKETKKKREICAKAFQNLKTAIKLLKTPTTLTFVQVKITTNNNIFFYSKRKHKAHFKQKIITHTTNTCTAVNADSRNFYKHLESPSKA